MEVQDNRLSVSDAAMLLPVINKTSTLKKRLEFNA